MIAIVDYGMGNPGSILNMLKKLGNKACISADLKEIEYAEKLILPGVGSFDNGMKNINEKGLLPILNKKVIDEKVPILGICLGMQLMTRKSEEGILDGLKWLNAITVRFKFDGTNSNLKIPHMGWNTVDFARKSPLTTELGDEPKFYFVHSYHVVCENIENAILNTFYGLEFTSAIQKDNIFGVQFHPEKSHNFGMRILKNFINL